MMSLTLNYFASYRLCHNLLKPETEVPAAVKEEKDVTQTGIAGGLGDGLLGKKLATEGLWLDLRAPELTEKGGKLYIISGYGRSLQIPGSTLLSEWPKA